MAIDFRQAVHPHVAGGNRQEATGTNLASMGDKYKSLAVIDREKPRNSFLPSIVPGCERALAPALEPLLDDVTPVMLRFSGLHLKRQLLGTTIQRCKSLPHFIGGKKVGHLRATCGYQEEGAP